MSSTQRLQLFHGFVSEIYFNTVIAGLIMRQMYEMLRHYARSADFYNLSRNAYRNNDLRVKMLHPTTACYACFDDCRAWTVLIQTYKNISGKGGLNSFHPPPKYCLGNNCEI